MDVVDYRFPKENGLAVLWFAAGCTLVMCMVAIYWLLLQMERGYLLTVSNKLELQEELEEEEESSSSKKQTSPQKENKDKEKEEEEEVVRLRLTTTRKIILGFIVGILTLLLYLLLVKSNASAWLSWIGFGAFFFVLFRNHLGEEIIRRRRPDRFAGIVSAMLLMAMALHLIVYAAEQLADGQLHQGKARIIGYDSSQYDDNTKQKDDTITRTDLWVSWGGSWGCPSHPNTYCEAAVQGALCNSETKDADQNERRRRRRRRFLDDNQGGADSSGGGGGDDSAASASNAADSSQQQQQQTEDELEQELEDEKQQNEELEQEVQDEEAANEELEQEEEGLEDEVEEYKDYTEELEDCIEKGYFYEDDYFYDEYWSEQDWDSVWGEYTCADLFTEEMDASSYDPSTPPGQDDWPFINIYGNCKTCEAYIVDYFSTENFQTVQNYKVSARNYGMAAAISLVLTALLALKQRISPTGDNEIELLSRHGSSPFHGALA